MGIITANNDGKRLWGEDNCIYYKSICATYKIHYKVYRGSTTYNEETEDIDSGTNSFTISATSPQTRYLDIEFFDADGNKFLPYNYEFYTFLKANSGGSGILTILSDGTVRAVVATTMQDDSQHPHAINFEWDSKDEDIDEREVTIAFDFAQ